MPGGKQPPKDSPPKNPDAFTPEDFSDEGLKAWAQESRAETVPDAGSPESAQPEVTGAEERPAEPEAGAEPSKTKEPPSEEGEPEEAKPEEKGEEKPEEEEEPFDKEKLTPAQRKAWDEMEARVAEKETSRQDLERRLTEQGRILAAAEKVVQEKVDTFKAEIDKAQQEFNQAYAYSKDNEEGWLNQSAELEKQAKDAEENGDNASAQDLRNKAREAKETSYRWEQNSRRMQDHFDKWLGNRKSMHSEDMEDAYLQANPECASVKNVFDDFCRDMGRDPLEVKSDIKSLHRMYPRCLSAERGKPENIEKIRANAEKLALQVAREKKGAAAPEAPGSARDQSPAPKDWADGLESEQRKRDDPNAI
jgi:hypothetical protein